MSSNCLLWYNQLLVITSVLTTIHFLHPTACTITPLNPTTLTATGGEVVSGTINVTIQCVCLATSDQRVRWYNTSKDFLTQRGHQRYVAGSPYFIPNDPNGATLVIPTFTDFYAGAYHCGIFVNDTVFTSPSAAVALTIGELMINTVSYLYVAT